MPSGVVAVEGVLLETGGISCVSKDMLSFLDCQGGGSSGVIKEESVRACVPVGFLAILTTASSTASSVLTL